MHFIVNDIQVSAQYGMVRYLNLNSQQYSCEQKILKKKNLTMHKFIPENINISNLALVASKITNNS